MHLYVLTTQKCTILHNNNITNNIKTVVLCLYHNNRHGVLFSRPIKCSTTYCTAHQRLMECWRRAKSSTSRMSLACAHSVHMHTAYTFAKCTHAHSVHMNTVGTPEFGCRNAPESTPFCLLHNLMSPWSQVGGVQPPLPRVVDWQVHTGCTARWTSWFGVWWIPCARNSTIAGHHASTLTIYVDHMCWPPWQVLVVMSLFG